MSEKPAIKDFWAWAERQVHSDTRYYLSSSHFSGTYRLVKQTGEMYVRPQPGDNVEVHPTIGRKLVEIWPKSRYGSSVKHTGKTVLGILRGLKPKDLARYEKLAAERRAAIQMQKNDATRGRLMGRALEVKKTIDYIVGEAHKIDKTVMTLDDVLNWRAP